ncbi:MAG: Nif3-like dinuclear metal center hexameric protein, partial [Halapricum sp.]
EFGPARIEDVAIVTGSGVDWLEAAAEAGVDAFVTGEGKQKAYHLAREHGIHVFLAGHYATETFGVKALQELLEEWDLKTTFIHEPTGL